MMEALTSFVAGGGKLASNVFREMMEIFLLPYTLRMLKDG